MKVAVVMLLIVGAIACIRAGIVGESPITFLTRLVQPGSGPATA